MGKNEQDDIRTIYNDIRKRVKKRYDKRKEFFGHFVSYLVINIFFWTVLTAPNNFGSGLLGGVGALVTVGWTVGLFIHLLDWLSEEMVDRAVEREMERAGFTNLYQYEKSKRDERLVRLSDDGELLDFEADAEPFQQAQK